MLQAKEAFYGHCPCLDEEYATFLTKGRSRKRGFPANQMIDDNYFIFINCNTNNEVLSGQSVVKTRLPTLSTPVASKSTKKSTPFCNPTRSSSTPTSGIQKLRLSKLKVGIPLRQARRISCGTAFMTR